MSGINSEFIAINRIELEKAIDIIEDINTKSNPIETKILETLTELRKSILINGQTISNNENLIYQNLQTYKTNSIACHQVFRALITRYVESVDNAVNYINSKKEEI